MHETIAGIRRHPLFRAAIVAPIAIMIIFSLFNLTAATDQQKIPSAITLGIVNLDQGAEGAPGPLAEQALNGLAAGLPVGTARFDDEATATTALDEGDISALLIFPATFTAEVLSGEPVAIRFVGTQHLSLAETQFTRFLGGQLEGSLSAAVSGIRQSLAAAAAPAGSPSSMPQPAVEVSSELLHVAHNPAAISAPFVMTFATWMSAFVGALMTFIASRIFKGSHTIRPVGLLRTLLPIVVPAISAIALSIVVAWTTNNWGQLLSIWLFVWLAAAAIGLLFEGLFAVIGFFAVLLVIPAVFYQSALSGTQAPTGALPDWLGSIADAIPFSAIGTGYRTLVIGGPEGSLPYLLLLGVAVVGIALVWIGTWFHHRSLTSAG